MISPPAGWRSFQTECERRDLIADASKHARYNELAMLLGVKTIHVSERDTQISQRPKEVGEFVNTWSIEGFREEGIAPCEMGWGTHERTVPPRACFHDEGPQNQICLAQMGCRTWVRSWVPYSEIVGMVIRHGEAFSISEYLTVRNEYKVPIYRPTVHYAYCPLRPGDREHARTAHAELRSAAQAPHHERRHHQRLRYPRRPADGA